MSNSRQKTDRFANGYGISGQLVRELAELQSVILGLIDQYGIGVYQFLETDQDGDNVLKTAIGSCLTKELSHNVGQVFVDFIQAYKADSQPQNNDDQLKQGVFELVGIFLKNVQMIDLPAFLSMISRINTEIDPQNPLFSTQEQQEMVEQHSVRLHSDPESVSTSDDSDDQQLRASDSTDDSVDDESLQVKRQGMRITRSSSSLFAVNRSENERPSINRVCSSGL